MNKKLKNITLTTFKKLAVIVLVMVICFLDLSAAPPPQMHGNVNHGNANLENALKEDGTWWCPMNCFFGGRYLCSVCWCPFEGQCYDIIVGL
ncbi:8753_t:CDS:1, partial [Ambispora leptoticha]